jgi:hypothetical protein
MNLADCYRILGLRTGAPYQDIKAAYRRLVRDCHPDANPGDREAEAKFIRLTNAYKRLLEHVPPDASVKVKSAANGTGAKTGAKAEAKMDCSLKVKVTRPTPPTNQSSTSPASPPIQFTEDLSDIERKLKQQSYDQLQEFLKNQRFPRAIALVEGLAQRLPQDMEVRQWQAITYQRWARQLINQKQFDKARVYLKKALKTDPRNRTLWAEIEKEFQRLEHLY